MTNRAIKIISELPNLSQKELATVRAAADHLLTKGDDIGGCERLLFDALLTAVKVKINFQQFKGMNAYKAWTTHGKSASDFMTQLCPDAKRVTVTALARLLVDALVADLASNHIPITLGTLTANLGRIPQVFEDCFPGYQGSGMIHWVLRTMEKKT